MDDTTRMTTADRRGAGRGRAPPDRPAGRFLARRAAEAAGLFLNLASVALAAALTSYDARDPSLNAAVEEPARNLLGAAGAWTADFLLQTIGLTAWFLVLLLLAWAWRIASHRGLGRAWTRMAALPGALVLGAVAFAALPLPEGWSPPAGGGGAVGGILLAGLSGPSGLWPDGPAGAVGLLAGLAAAAAAVFVMGLDRREWRAIGGPARAAPRAVGRLFRRPAPAMPLTAADPAAPERPPRKEPVLRESAPPVAPPAAEGEPARPRRGRAQADKSRQTALDLEGTGAEFMLPATGLLDPPAPPPRAAAVDDEALQANARLLESVLGDFGVKGEIIRVSPGPVVTLYELEPAPGTKSSRVIGLADDIARSMSARAARIAVVPGRSVIGIELPNQGREIVALRELLESSAFERDSGQLTLLLGKDIGGTPVLADLARMPHLLIAGTTGSGKSVAINTMILSLLYRLAPRRCRLIMIDPKMLELSVYDGIPHLLTPVVTEPGKAVVALRWAVREMENRYRAMSGLGVRNIHGYNARLAEAEKKGETLYRSVEVGRDPETGKPVREDQPIDMTPYPFIVVIVDEMADLMLVAGKEIEAAVQRLSQMARAAGIHLVMATQRPSVDVITGTIKANFPTRASFQVTSKVDSRTILGEVGAEHLLGEGDMLHMAGAGRITRVHGPFVSDEEVERVAGYLRDQGPPAYVEEVTEPDDEVPLSGDPGSGDGGEGDALYDQALALVMREGKASTSFVQRHLQIGYNRAARLIERMEADGVISPANHVGQRQVLMRRSEPDAE